jgi:hypothetical protein
MVSMDAIVVPLASGPRPLTPPSRLVPFAFLVFRSVN